MIIIKVKYSLSYIFLIIILIFPVLHIISKDRDFSIIENRYLEKFPKFTFDSLLSGEFNDKLSSYLEDQFPFRDNFISIKTYFEIILGRRDINGVYIGKNDYLIEKFDSIDLNITNKNIELINNLSKYYNIDLMLIPTSSEILKDSLPAFSINIDQNKYLKYIENNINKNITLINPIDYLKRKNYQYIYYYTDHHYTTLGAYYCYLKFSSDKNITPMNKNDFIIEKVSDNFLGSLFSKVNLINQKRDSIHIFKNKKDNKIKVIYPNKVENSLYEFSYLDNPRSQYNIFLDNNHPLIKIKTSVHNNKKLCIIKDSFANCFIPFLINHFEEIHVIDLRFYGTNIIPYLKENNLEDILIYYNIKNFAEDKNLIFIDKK